MSRSVKVNAALNTMLTVSNMFIGVVTTPYVTRVLTVEGYGDVNFAQSISTWLSALCLVGIPTYGVRECARVRDNPKALAQIVRELLVIITVFTAIVLLCFSLCIFYIPKLGVLAPLMWMYLVSTLLLSYGVEWYYQAMEQYEYITVRNLAFKLLSLIAIFCFVRNQDDWLVYGAILALLICGNNAFNFIRLLRTVSFRNLGSPRLRRHIKPLSSYALLSISQAFYLSFDSVILGMVNTNNVQVALYQVAAKIKGICFKVVNAIVGALIPRLSYYVKNDLGRYQILLRHGFGFTFNLCIGIMLYLIVSAESIVILMSSEKYLAAVLPVQIIGAVNFFSCMSYFFGLCILSPLDRENKLAAANMLGVPISLVLNFILDWHFGATGAAIAVLVSEIVIFLKQVYDSFDILIGFVSFKNVMRTFLCHIIAFSVVFIINIFLLPIIPLEQSSTIEAMIKAFGNLVVYCIMWLVLSIALREETAMWVLDTGKRHFFKSRYRNR